MSHQESDRPIVVYAVGDVTLNRAAPATAFDSVRSLLQQADIVFGNCEIVYTTQAGAANPSARAVVKADPDNVAGLASAGFDVMSFANNHHMDAGYDGFFQTIDHLRAGGIAVCGVGSDLDQARTPVIVEAAGRRVAFLGYSCILPAGYEAGTGKPGCAPLDIITHYSPREPEQPGSEARVTTFVDPTSAAALAEDIAQARRGADTVIVSIHWGVHSTPVVTADYETQLGRIAIDAGAAVVLGHHQHILKGIEVYRGKTIFHGLGNFVIDLDLREFTLDPSAASAVSDMQAHNPEYFLQFYEDYPTYPFHPDARMTVLAKIIIEPDGKLTTSCVPALINQHGQPVPLDASSGDDFTRVVDYQRSISERAGFDTDFIVSSEELVIVANERTGSGSQLADRKENAR